MGTEDRIGRGVDYRRAVGQTVKVGDREFQLDQHQVDVLRVISQSEGFTSVDDINRSVYDGHASTSTIPAVISKIRGLAGIPGLVANQRGEGYYLTEDVVLGDTTLLGRKKLTEKIQAGNPTRPNVPGASSESQEIFRDNGLETPKEPFKYSLRDVARIVNQEETEESYHIGRVDAYRDMKFTPDQILEKLGVKVLFAVLAHSDIDLAFRLGIEDDQIRTSIACMLEDDITRIRGNLIQLQLAVPQMRGTSLRIHVLTDGYRKELIEGNLAKLEEKERIQRKLLERRTDVNQIDLWTSDSFNSPTPTVEN
mgnify:FL=1